MAHFLDLFSPVTYEAFKNSARDITGFRMRQLNAAKRIHPGDRLLCYMTKISRWFGILEVTSEHFIDDTPIFYPDSDPFVVRFKVRPITWLKPEKAIPIHEDDVWNNLTFTKDRDKTTSTWTGKIRSSLAPIEEADGVFLERLILGQQANGNSYPLDGDKFQKMVTQRVRRADKTVAVFVPEGDEPDQPVEDQTRAVRDSLRIQGLLANIGEAMGFRVWLPRNDRGGVLSLWNPQGGSLLDSLPLNYDDTTLKTIEQIDVIWLKGRAIVRAFEVEHTTSVYSGILRMADLLALQPNMDIRLHIVAPFSRRDKVFQEIQRPVFSLLEKCPLAECYTYISYDSLEEFV